MAPDTAARGAGGVATCHLLVVYLRVLLCELQNFAAAQRQGHQAKVHEVRAQQGGEPGL